MIAVTLYLVLSIVAAWLGYAAFNMVGINATMAYESRDWSAKRLSLVMVWLVVLVVAGVCTVGLAGRLFGAIGDLEITMIRALIWVFTIGFWWSHVSWMPREDDNWRIARFLVSMAMGAVFLLFLVLLAGDHGWTIIDPSGATVTL